jgi:serine/threonine protein kinase
MSESGQNRCRSKSHCDKERILMPYTITPGQRLTDYASVDVTVQRVARGGMGLVAFGPDRLWDGRWRALKTMLPDRLARTPRLRDQFVREALTWVGIWPHANLMLAQSATEIDGVPFLILDFAEHGSLHDLLTAARRQGLPHLPLHDALLLAQMVAAGLVALHHPDPDFPGPEPLVHRDLKPDNILLCQAGQGQVAQITEFGLAKVADVALEEDLPDLPSGDAADLSHSRRYRTARGIGMGTVMYMPPEQWTDAVHAGPPADLYAFGQILAELVTGQYGVQPEGWPSEESWLAAHLSGRPSALGERVPEVPSGLEVVYQACLAKEAGARPKAEEVLAAVQAAARERGEQPYTPPEVYAHTPEHEMMRWHNWAITFDRFGRYEEALARNERALALAPQHPSVLLTRATILGRLRRTEEALAAYDAALAGYPAEDHLGRSAVLTGKGATLNEARRYAEAEAVYAQALGEMPDKADAWFNRANNQRQWAEAEREAGRTEAAREHARLAVHYAQKAVRLAPNNQINQRVAMLAAQLLRELGG